MVELDAWRIFVSTGGTPDCILEVVQEQNLMMEVERPTASSSFAYKHRWICAQCYKNGQIVERKGKTQYCTSRGNPHSWRDPLLYVHIGNDQRLQFNRAFHHVLLRKMVYYSRLVGCIQQKHCFLAYNVCRLQKY